ncbi:hypothetical protein BD779DRAFT_1500573 [Infundibulicybe gibba]|nr:hypothetical protein BD779DRAFT_1500573 [Infundibulicybe gibba]
MFNPWRYEHPNGDIYFFNQELRLVTDADVYDDDVRADLTLTGVTSETADVGIVSRAAGTAFEDEGNGLKLLTDQERFWSHMAEHPSHHPHLPPCAEAVFTKALFDAKEGTAKGIRYPLTGLQIDQTIHIYRQLKVAESQGANMAPNLGWLMGAVMPLDPLPPMSSMPGRGEIGELEAIMAKLQF